jgi:hypothetical protein
MARKSSFARCVFIPAHHRENLPVGSVVYDVSSYADPPYCTLSPMWVHGGIPIPGMPGQTSDTVEGIWQGLKVIRGKIATRYFRGPGQKRGGKPSGHKYGGKELGIVEARRRIYVVAYEWVLEYRIDPELIRHFVETARSGVMQFFHDVGDNGDLNDPDRPLAHAAVLVQYLNRRCVEENA